MRTIKKGDTGADVRLLQEMIGVTADGIFGAITESKVKAYQRAHNLTADGIVGVKTWAALGCKSEDTAKSERADKPAIVVKGITRHVTKSKGRHIKYIAVHYTAGTTSKAGTAMSSRNYFQNSDRKASADFIVDDATIVQANADIRNQFCWAVGDNSEKKKINGSRVIADARNSNTISIEICSNLNKGLPKGAASHPNHQNWYFTDAALDNARKLIRWLMSEYNVPKANVVRHYDISGKLCPGIAGWNNGTLVDYAGKSSGYKNNSAKWESFWESI